jgi:hypothetical protein
VCEPNMCWAPSKPATGPAPPRRFGPIVGYALNVMDNDDPRPFALVEHLCLPPELWYFRQGTAVEQPPWDKRVHTVPQERLEEAIARGRAAEIERRAEAHAAKGGQAGHKQPSHRIPATTRGGGAAAAAAAAAAEGSDARRRTTRLAAAKRRSEGGGGEGS